MTQTIEQLTARVRELEAEVERLSVAHVKACQANADSQDELAASQLHAEQLREALTTCVCAMQDYQAGIGITEMFDKGERLGRKALTIPASTEALDKYVAERVKEAGKFDMWKTNPYTKVLETSIKQLTRQRDLAVEALKAIAGRRIFIDNLASNVDIAVMTLDTIKESEEN